MQPVARTRLLTEARRQVAAAKAHNLQVEWLVNQQAAVTELGDYSGAEGVNITVRFVAE